MPSKKKKYNARFPAGRIKKIMQTDEEVGKVAQAVPVIISRTLELFVESLLTKTLRITNARNAKTLSPSHMKQCIMSESRFDFLRELVKNIPDITISEEMALECNSPGPSCDNNSSSAPSSPQSSVKSGYNQQCTGNDNGYNVAGQSNLHIQPNGGENLTKPITLSTQMHSNSLDSSLAFSKRLNFYKENDNSGFDANQNNSSSSSSPSSSSVIKHTSNHFNSKSFNCSSNNINSNNNNNNNNNHSHHFHHQNNNSGSGEYGRPPKLARYDSAPPNLYAISTPNIASYSKPILKINTPNINLKNDQQQSQQPIFNIDLSKSLQNQINVPIQKTGTDEIAPIIKIDLSNSFTAIPSTSKQLNIPSPPVINSDICNTPIVKIDYSKMILSTTETNDDSPPLSFKTCLPSTSSKSSINTSISTPSNLINIQSTPKLDNNSTSSTLDLDEDYDNL